MPITMNDTTRKLVEFKQDYPSNYAALLSNFSTIITDSTKREAENLLPTGALSSTPYYRRTDKILAQMQRCWEGWLKSSEDVAHTYMISFGQFNFHAIFESVVMKFKVSTREAEEAVMRLMTKNDHPYGWTIYAVSQNGPAPICRDPDVVREYSPDEEYVLCVSIDPNEHRIARQISHYYGPLATDPDMLILSKGSPYLGMCTRLVWNGQNLHEPKFFNSCLYEAQLQLDQLEETGTARIDLKKPDYHDLESPGDANLYPEDKIGAISKTSFAETATPTACEYDPEDETLYWNGEDMGLPRFDLRAGGTRLCAIDSRNPYKFNSLAIICADIDSPQTVRIDPAESYVFETH